MRGSRGSAISDAPEKKLAIVVTPNTWASTRIHAFTYSRTCFEKLETAPVLFHPEMTNK